MRIALLSLVLVVLALPSGAAAEERGEITVKKLYNQFTLICVTEDAKDQAEQEAALYSGSQRGQDAQNRTSQKIEELESHQDRLDRMIDKYVTAKRLEWHETKDVAKKLRIEDDIKKAQEIGKTSCDD